MINDQYEGFITLSLEKLDHGKMKKLSSVMGFNGNVLHRLAITTVVAKRLRVCSREPIRTTKAPKVTVARWATIAIACFRNILSKKKRDTIRIHYLSNIFPYEKPTFSYSFLENDSTLFSCAINEGTNNWPDDYNRTELYFYCF